MINYFFSKTIDIQKLYFRMLLLFLITTLFQSFSLFSGINKILFAFTFIIQVYLLIKSKFTVIDVFVFMLLILNYLYAIIQTNFPLYNLNDLFYFGFWVIFSIYISSRRELLIEYLKRDEKYVITIIKIWTGLVFISIFLPSSYPKFWGGKGYFASFTGSVFRLAPTAVMIMSLVLICMEIYKRKRAIVYTIIPMFCFYMGGSRTYLGVGLLLFMIIWYLYCPKKSVFYITVIPLIIVAALLISYSAVGDKIEATTYTKASYLDSWGTVTSGRSVFWKADIEAFELQPIAKKLLGSGFNFVYEVNIKAVNSEIWAHNDFINILLNFGFLGLLLYLYGVHSMKSRMLKNCLKIPNILLNLFFFIWFINAMFNMFYTYFCSMISFPFIAIGFSNRHCNKDNEKLDV